MATQQKGLGNVVLMLGTGIGVLIRQEERMRFRASSVSATVGRKEIGLC